MSITSPGTEQSLVVVPPAPPVPPVAPKLKIKIPFRSWQAKRPAPSAQFNWDLFYDTVNVQSKSGHVERMLAFITAQCEAMGAVVVADKGNLYVQKGESPTGIYPCFVAHTDTVHSLIDDEAYRIYYDADLIFAWDIKADKATGIGGDDKVGVFIALECLRTLPFAKAAFFRDEEIGCLGAHEAIMSFFDDCAFVLQADRREASDFIIHASGEQLSDKAFQAKAQPALDLFGFKPYRFGLPTDVATLKRQGLAVCAANVSCGYYNPHGATEYIIAGDVEHTLLLFQSLATDLGGERWVMTKEEEPRPVYRHAASAGRFRPSSYHHRLRVPLPAERFTVMRNGKDEKTSDAFRAAWDRAHPDVIWDAILAERKRDEQRWTQRYGFGMWGEYGEWDFDEGGGTRSSTIALGAGSKMITSIPERNSVAALLKVGYGLQMYQRLCNACLDQSENAPLCNACLAKIDADLALEETYERIGDGRANTEIVCECGGEPGTALYDPDEGLWFCLTCEAYVLAEPTGD